MAVASRGYQAILGIDDPAFGICTHALAHRAAAYDLSRFRDRLICRRDAASPQAKAARPSLIPPKALMVVDVAEAASPPHCAPKRPLDYLGSAGLVWAINGGRLLELHRDWAVIDIPVHGSQRIFYRRNVDAAKISLPWARRD
jgi:hypothetical protein